VSPEPITSLPEDTAQAARSVFNIENLYLAIGDQLDRLFDGIDLAALDARHTGPIHRRFILALVTIFQFEEDLADAAAVEALRTRTDWKYALHLPLDHPGIAPAQLREFRQRLLQDATGQRTFGSMLIRLRQLGLGGSRNRRGADEVTVLTTVESLSHLEMLVQAMNQALEALASEQPGWLTQVSPPYWYERYQRGQDLLRQSCSTAERDALAQAICSDISHLLAAINDADDPALAMVPEVEHLRRFGQRH
jgi:transposase